MTGKQIEVCLRGEPEIICSTASFSGLTPEPVIELVSR